MRFFCLALSSFLHRHLLAAIVDASLYLYIAGFFLLLREWMIYGLNKIGLFFSFRFFLTVGCFVGLISSGGTFQLSLI